MMSTGSPDEPLGLIR